MRRHSIPGLIHWHSEIDRRPRTGIAQSGLGIATQITATHAGRPDKVQEPYRQRFSTSTLTLVDAHEYPLRLESNDMFVHEPSATRLEVAVELLDVFVGLWDTAEAQYSNNSVDAALLDQPLARDVLNAIRHDLIPSIQPSVRSTLAQRSMVRGIGLYAIDRIHPGPLSESLLPSDILVAKDVDPHATSRTDLNDPSTDTWLHGIGSRHNGTRTYSALQEWSNTRLTSRTDLRACPRPEPAKPSKAEGVPRGKGLVVAAVDEVEDRPGEVGNREGKEDPWVQKTPEDLRGCHGGMGDEGDGESGRWTSKQLRLLDFWRDAIRIYLGKMYRRSVTYFAKSVLLLMLVSSCRRSRR